MAGPLSGVSQLDPDVGTHYDRALVSRLEVLCPHIGYGEERNLPMNLGTKSTFGKYDNLADATTALTDGVTPVGSQSSRTEVVLTIAWYGDYLTYTDQIQEVGVDPGLLKIFKGILAYQAARTLDTLMRDIINAGTQVVYAGTATSRATVAAFLTAADLAAAENALERVGVPTVAKRITPGTGIGTAAVLPGYIGIGHSDLRKDFQDLNAGGAGVFINVKDYAQQGKAYPGEIGAVGQTRVILTPQGKIVAGGATGVAATSGARVTNVSGTDRNDVYTFVVFGEEFYTNLRLGSKSIKSIVKGLGSAGTEDPLDQRATAGWKTAWAGGIQDETRGVRIEVACESLALD